MLKALKSDPELSRFLSIAIILGMGLQCVFALVQPNVAWLIGAMWSPAIAAFALKRRREILQNLKRIELRWICFGILLAAAPYVIGQLIYAIGGLGHWDSDKYAFIGTTGRLTIKTAKLILGNQEQTFAFFLINMTASLLFAGTMTTLFAAVGEEIGWRGFLQERLSGHFGLVKGIICLGIIWGYWHIPSNLAGVNGTEHPLLNTFVIFPVGVIFITFTLAWVRIQSKAIWPCAFFHGMNNATEGSLPFVPNSELTGQLTNLAGYILVGSIFIFLVRKKSRVDSRVG